MPRKAKPTKHSSAELNKRAAASLGFVGTNCRRDTPHHTAVDTISPLAAASTCFRPPLTAVNKSAPLATLCYLPGRAPFVPKGITAVQNKGGGSAGLADRKGGAAGHSRFLCTICGVQAPSLVSMKAHHDSKHVKLPWDPSLYEDVQAKHGGTTQGVAVRGTTNAKKLKGKNPKADLDDLLAAGLRAGKK